MQRHWKEKNVDLALLTTRIEDFFKEKNFDAIKGEVPTGYQILAEDSPFYKIIGHVSVTIEGNPDDFTVEFELSEERKKHSLPRGIFFESMFFGGYLTLRRLKSSEAWVKLGEDFWSHVENAVLQLTDSAQSAE
jgi:hypothetical protein